MLDGEFLKGFKRDVIDEKEIIVKQTLPSKIALGGHTLQVIVTLPEYKDTDKSEFKVEEIAAKSDLDEFWAGPMHLTGLKAKYDKFTDTYSGGGDFILPVANEPVSLEYKRLKIEKRDGKNILVSGIITAVVNKEFERGPLKIGLTKIMISTEKVAADGTVTFAGTDSLPGIGPFYFYAAGISENGVKALINLGSPQKGNIGFFEVAISDIFFSFQSEGVTLKARGWITTTPTRLFTMFINFGYSPSGTEFTYGFEKEADWESLINN